MRILVIGGTYFLGKSFVEIASKENEIVLLNRGNRNVSFQYPGHISKVICDRHEIEKAVNDNSLLQEKYDVVVDFCAYEEGDIASVVDVMHENIGQYIFVSTVDVYKRGTSACLDEAGELETRNLGGQAGEYILGKSKLEKELVSSCEKYGIHYNSIRPAFIYGPENYANREEIFFNWIEKANQVLIPVDAIGSFYMVYVDDVAKALLKLCGNKKCNDKSFNIIGKEKVTYEIFFEALKKAVKKDFERIDISVEDINNRGILFPFPLTEEDSERYCSIYGDLLGVEYTPLSEGLSLSYRYRLKKRIMPTIDAFFDDNNPKGALEYMLSMREIAAPYEDSEMNLILLNELIGYYRQTSEKENLLGIIDDSIDLLKNSDVNPLKKATTFLNCANAYRSMGMFEEAKNYYSVAEDIYNNQMKEGTLSKNDLLIAGLYNNKSLLYQELSDFKNAKECLLMALEIALKLNAGFEIAVTYANLANTCLLSKEFEQAKEYALTAIRLFKARGLEDPHYCAALSALGSCYFEEGDLDRARSVFHEAMCIVENTIGKNSQYERLKDNLNKCVQKSSGDSFLEDADLGFGINLSKKYYESYGAPMISKKFLEYEGKIAVGLVGEGSDCFGFDDRISADHDYGPSFCMWLSDETYDEIGDALQKAYEELPDSFEGVTRTNTAMGANRRGVMRISDFYKKFVGTDVYDEIDFMNVEDYALSTCVNGMIFRDDEGLFTKIRNSILDGYKEQMRYLKIASSAASFSQCAQYNYLRMLNRMDETTAFLMLSDGIKHALKLWHYISNVYPPHDKWLMKSAGKLEQGDKVIRLVNKISNQFMTKVDKRDVAGAVEELADFLVHRMYEKNIISDVNPYLDYHTDEILFKSSIIELSKEELVERIVRLEFEAFDKVQNEGGRASCQNNWPTFSIMRKSQYLTWNINMLVQYMYDFSREYRKGHNLITEKYGRMMESTAPDRWNEIKGNFPELSDEKKAIVEQIVGVQIKMAEDFAIKHPKMANQARSLHTNEDEVYNTSYETYLRGEISTYSDKMLQLYGVYVVDAIQNGINITYITMENTAKLYGYESIEACETKI